MGEMLLRWLVSFGASCYIIAAVVGLPAWMSRWRAPLAAWWAVYLAAELIVLGALASFALWWFLWRAGGSDEPYHPWRLLGLTAMTLAPVFGFLVIPIGCRVSLPPPAGAIAGWSVFAASAIALLTFWVFSRYARR